MESPLQIQEVPSFIKVFRSDLEFSASSFPYVSSNLKLLSNLFCRKPSSTNFPNKISLDFYTVCIQHINLVCCIQPSLYFLVSMSECHLKKCSVKYWFQQTESLILIFIPSRGEYSGQLGQDSKHMPTTEQVSLGFCIQKWKINEEQLILSIIDAKFRILCITSCKCSFYCERILCNPNVGYLSDFKFSHGVYLER